MRSRRTIWLVAATMFGAACTDSQPTLPPISAAGSSTAPTVTSADPDNAPQDTTLDVIVNGSGFDRGSSAQWAIAGVPSDKIHTNNTRFVSSKQLVANITIAIDADPVLYDVLVTTGGGKKGIGTELFTVRQRGQPPRDSTPAFPVSMTFGDAAADNIRSDAEVRVGDPTYTGASYVDGVCGVSADVGSFADARLSPAGGYQKTLQKTCGSSRKLVFEWDAPDDGGGTKPTRVDAIFMTIDDLEDVAPGRTELRHAQFNVCNRLFFDPNDSHFPGNGSDLLLVTFDDKGDVDPANDEWLVRTQPYPNDKAFCQADLRLWHMTFSVTIRRK